MSVFAVGKLAYGFCDRCGQRFDLSDLRSERDTGILRNNKVCPSCFDPDHPQNFLFKVRTDDRIALRDPRPDNTLDQSRSLGSWNPVGMQYTSEVKASVGIAKVLTP